MGFLSQANAESSTYNMSKYTSRNKPMKCKVLGSIAINLWRTLTSILKNKNIDLLMKCIYDNKITLNIGGTV